MKRIRRIENDRNNLVIGYILEHKGCNKQDVVDGLEEKISRVTIFKCINDLIENNVIRAEKLKQNSKSYLLFIDDDDPYVVVPKDIKEFETKFFSLLEKIIQFYNKKIPRVRTNKFQVDERELEKVIKTIKDPLELYKAFTEDKETLAQEGSKRFNKMRVDEITLAIGLLAIALEILNEFIASYLLKVSFVWPSQFRSKKVLNEISQLTIKRIIEIQTKVSEKLDKEIKALSGRDMARTLVLRLLTDKENMERNSKIFQSSGIELEANAVLQLMWRLKEDFNHHLNPILDWSYLNENYEKWKNDFSMVNILIEKRRKDWELNKDIAKRDKLEVFQILINSSFFGGIRQLELR